MDQIQVRTYRPSDQQAVRRLYDEGRLEGTVQPNDTGADIDNIESEYLSKDRTHFWVAYYQDCVVGMIGVDEADRQVAEIRRLRVEPSLHGRGIGMKLLETSLGFCRHHGYLKVILDTRLRKGEAISIFDKFAFQHTRTRQVQGKELLEFYLDLYRTPGPDQDESAA